MNQFETTYQENYNRMFNIGLKMTNDEEVVRDIIQDIFEKFYLRTKNGISISKPQNWLVKATIYSCIDWNKSRNRFKDNEEALNMVSDEKQLATIQNNNALEYALSKLKSEERTIIILYSEGFKYLEIADITDVKHTSIGQTIARILRKMEKILKAINYELY
ncbi:MAG: sigma-70 family RNA polymerase sigma factor [Bacteroidales bacterium]|nr:sigma-70 family RNA polymerase sigma factor [Bacteroidales bacterium]